MDYPGDREIARSRDKVAAMDFTEKSDKETAKSCKKTAVVAYTKMVTKKQPGVIAR